MNCPDCPAQFLDLSSMTAPSVFLAGLVDGFNPCAFTIVIVLAGVLAAAGHSARARLLGGVAFCVGSFLTYVAMGLGLLQVLRAVEGVGVVRSLLHLVLSLTLFGLSCISLRDALRYRREKTPQAIMLQLPNWVKVAIRKVAECSWSGPKVVVGGVLCGIVVTLLDSLCTGQVYVPILSLIAMEGEKWRELGLLLGYNLAFIAPLVVVFVLAARGATSETMRKWSKRNVFPAKLALSVVFFILAIALFPKFGGIIANWQSS